MKRKSGIFKKILIVIGIIIVLGVIGEIAGGDEEKEPDKIETNLSSNKEKNKEDMSDEQADKKEKSVPFEKELKKYKSGDYPYITKKDLAKYYANMKGVKFRTTIKVDDIKDGVIQSTITKGFMMSNFKSKTDYSGIVENGDTVAIIGKVKGSKSYGILGKSLDFSNCMVIAKGKDANKYKKDATDESLSQYLVMTKKVADSGVKLTGDEYKSICETLNYTEILRNPDSFKNVRCKISGNVSQIVEGIFGVITIYVKDSGGNTWGCTHKYGDGETHLLENDYVTIYGECNGTDTASTVLGKQVTMPVIDVEYIDR